MKKFSDEIKELAKDKSFTHSVLIPPKGIPKGELNLIYGTSGTGKSYLSSTIIHTVKQRVITEMKVPAIIVDLDDTIAQGNDRLIFYKTEPRNWEALAAGCEFDTLKEEVVDQIQEYRKKNAIVRKWWGDKNILGPRPHVVILTARTETPLAKQNTLKWLRNCGLERNETLTDFYMRPVDDHRPDWECKRDLLAKIRETYEIIACFEDQQKVVDMFLEEGVPEVYHVVGNTLTKKLPPVVGERANIELMDTF